MIRIVPYFTIILLCSGCLVEVGNPVSQTGEPKEENQYSDSELTFLVNAKWSNLGSDVVSDEDVLKDFDERFVLEVTKEDRKKIKSECESLQESGDKIEKSKSDLQDYEIALQDFDDYLDSSFSSFDFFDSLSKAQDNIDSSKDMQSCEEYQLEALDLWIQILLDMEISTKISLLERIKEVELSFPFVNKMLDDCMTDLSSKEQEELNVIYQKAYESSGLQPSEIDDFELEGLYKEQYDAIFYRESRSKSCIASIEDLKEVMSNVPKD